MDAVSLLQWLLLQSVMNCDGVHTQGIGLYKILWHPWLRSSCNKWHWSETDFSLSFEDAKSPFKNVPNQRHIIDDFSKKKKNILENSEGNHSISYNLLRPWIFSIYFMLFRIFFGLQCFKHCMCVYSLAKNRQDVNVQQITRCFSVVFFLFKHFLLSIYRSSSNWWNSAPLGCHDHQMRVSVCGHKRYCSRKVGRWFASCFNCGRTLLKY